MIQQDSNTLSAIYARVSSQRQKEDETIESQIAALHALAHERGLFVPDHFVFSDNGVSGSILERSGLDEMRDVLRTEPIGTLLIYAPDRLSRNYAHQIMLLEEFKRLGSKVIFLKSSGTEDTPEGKLSAHLQGIFAEYERTLILDRSRRGRMHKAKQNDPAILPCVAYGYRREKTSQKTLVQIIEKEAVIVKEIFRLYTLEGYTIQKIAEEISAKGVLSPRGSSKWCVSTVRRILKNTAYTGATYYAKTERCEGLSDQIRHCRSGTFKKAKHARRNRPESEWIPIEMPQIISENDFELVQEKLRINVERASRHTKKPGLLQGLVICGICGRPFYKRSRRYPKRVLNAYCCSSRSRKEIKSCFNSRLNQEELDDLVYQEIITLLKNPHLIREELARRSQEASNSDEILRKETTIKKEFSKISLERDRLLDAYQSGLLDLDDLRTRNANIDARKKALDKEMRAIEAMRIYYTEESFLECNFKAILERMEAKADSLSFREKQSLIRLLVDKVVVKMDKVAIVHRISPRALKTEVGQLGFDGCG